MKSTRIYSKEASFRYASGAVPYTTTEISRLALPLWHDFWLGSDGLGSAMARIHVEKHVGIIQIIRSIIHLYCSHMGRRRPVPARGPSPLPLRRVGRRGRDHHLHGDKGLGLAGRDRGEVHGHGRRRRRRRAREGRGGHRQRRRQRGAAVADGDEREGDVGELRQAVGCGAGPAPAAAREAEVDLRCGGSYEGGGVYGLESVGRPSSFPSPPGLSPPSSPSPPLPPCRPPASAWCR